MPELQIGFRFVVALIRWPFTEQPRALVLSIRERSADCEWSHSALCRQRREPTLADWRRTETRGAIYGRCVMVLATQSVPGQLALRQVPDFAGRTVVMGVAMTGV